MLLEEEWERAISPFSAVVEVVEKMCKPVAIQENVDEIESELEINAAEDRNCSRKSETSMCDLPTEMLLEIFKHLNVRELCKSVAPVCKLWYILTRDPYIWKEFQFCRNNITTEKARELLRTMPLLQKITLHRRMDTNAILRQLTHSCQYLKILEIVSCKGSRSVRRISAFALSRVIKRAKKLRSLVLHDTYMRISCFNKLLEDHDYLKNVDTVISQW
jgi:hypothetical protein